MTFWSCSGSIWGPLGAAFGRPWGTLGCLLGRLGAIRASKATFLPHNILLKLDFELRVCFFEPPTHPNEPPKWSPVLPQIDEISLKYFFANICVYIYIYVYVYIPFLRTSTISVKYFFRTWEVMKGHGGSWGLGGSRCVMGPCKVKKTVK